MAKRPAKAVEKPKTKAKQSAGSLTPLYVGGAILVCGLVALVWWSIPGDHAPEGDDGGVVETATSLPEKQAGPLKKNQIERPPRASAELAIITSKTEDEVRAIATPSEIAKRLDVRHCGTACDAVKKLLGDEDAFDIDFLTTEDLILPPKDSYDTVAMGLTPGERESIVLKKNAVVLHVTANIEPNNVGARAAFATASVLAEALEGFVWDEVGRRIESKDEMLEHAIKVPLGQPVFSPRHIVVQLYRQEDGSARMMSLGMLRFGAPDLSIRGANMSSGPLLTNVLNAAAAQLIAGKNEGPLTITLADVAKVVGKKPSELSSNPADARPVVLDVLETDRIEGDPDNDLVELVPNNGASRENWDLVIASLFGAPPSMSTPIDDKELGDVAKKARTGLPDAIRRFRSGEGTFFVKGPFPIAQDNRVDGGPANELLWIEVASCDDKLCTGILSNEPTYATNIAPGKTTSVKRDEIADWMLQQRDGGTAGGESIKLLRARATQK